VSLRPSLEDQLPLSAVVAADAHLSGGKILLEQSTLADESASIEARASV
jgi:hypothetical protein